MQLGAKRCVWISVSVDGNNINNLRYVNDTVLLGERGVHSQNKNKKKMQI